MLRVLVFITCIFCIKIYGQKKTDTLKLYFSINESVSENNYLRLDSALNSLYGKQLDVAIYGYADFLSTDLYNVDLSTKRAQIIKKYLQKKVPSRLINIYACEGRGEKYSTANSSLQGEPLQRRVDIYFEPIVTFNVSDSKLETPKDTSAQIIQKKNIEELQAGESLALQGLSFEPGRHYVIKESASVLQNLLQTLKVHKNLKIEIQGHVCCTLNGSDGLDLDTREMKLSENRAKAVYDYLISKGISKSRLSYKGFGRSNPKVNVETTPEEEQANRRVEIMILEK